MSDYREFSSIVGTRVIDGDTYEFEIDLGFRVHTTQKVRLLGLDVPERYTLEGKAATAAVTSAITSAAQVTLRTWKDQTDKYGRWLGVVELDGIDLATKLRMDGFEK